MPRGPSTSTPIKSERQLANRCEILKYLFKIEDDITNPENSDDNDKENTIEFEDVIRETEEEGNGSEEETHPVSDGGVGRSKSKRRRIEPAALVWSDVDNFVPDILDFDSSNAGIQDCFPVVNDDPESENHIEYFEAFLMILL